MIKTLKISLGDEILRLESLGSDRQCMVEKNPSPNRSQTQTTKAAAVFFTEKGNNLNARARSAQSRTNLICHGLLGFDRGMGFVGLQFKGLVSVKKKRRKN